MSNNLSDIIEGFIKELLEASNQRTVEIQRNILAQQFDCSPSQINYVLTTRFNNDRGYIVESRRGGGGYIRIFKVRSSGEDDFKKILNESIGESITYTKAFDLLHAIYERSLISRRELKIMQSVLGDRALVNVSYDDRNKIRAVLLKEMILVSSEDD